MQEVLAGVQTGEVGSPMTMADATRFADNALEHMVRTLLTALMAPAILESTQGALRWDGLQYEKRYRRLLSPPLQRLLTQPGVLLGLSGVPTHALTQRRLVLGWGEVITVLSALSVL